MDINERINQCKQDPLKAKKYNKWLLNVGNGTQKNLKCQGYPNDLIQIPQEMLSKNEHIEDFVKEILPTITRKSPNFEETAILCPKNKDVSKVNEVAFNLFPGEEVILPPSIDTLIEEESAEIYDEEYLNTLHPNGMPPHELKCKLKFPMMLLRNLDPTIGIKFIFSYFKILFHFCVFFFFSKPCTQKKFLLSKLKKFPFTNINQY